MQSGWQRSFAAVLAFALLVVLARGADAQVATPSPADRATGVAVASGLSWKADAKANRYDVYLGTAPSPPLATRNLSTTTFQPTQPLQPSSTYYWRVDSRGPKNYSATGPVWTFTTAAAPLPPPSIPTGASPTSGAAGVAISTVLSWSASSNTTSYDVEFGTSVTPVLMSSAQSGTTYTPPAPLANAQTYYWRVTARGPGGTTAGPLWSFTTANAPPSATRDRLRLLTWNVQSGRDAAGVSAVDAQATLMADSGADVIALQEVTITQAGGDLTTVFKSSLERLTGVTWYQVWAPEPRTAGETPQGNLLLSRIPLLSSVTTQFDAAASDPSALDAKRSAAAATVVVNGVGVTLVTTRMPHDPAFRQSQASAFNTWVSAFATPRVIGGDFEMLTGDATYTSLTSTFGDIWPVLAGTTEFGFTTDARSGTAAVTGRVDYWLQEQVDAQARASEIWVVKTARSGHHALVVDVEVR